jgi:hypothetical protein
VHEREAGGAQRGAVGGVPAAFGAEGEHGGCGVRPEGDVGQAGGGFVVVEREAEGAGGKIGERGGERPAGGDGGQARAEGLLRTLDEVLAPFARGPECALGVAGVGAAGGDEVQRADAEGGALL